jgi:hypothetical protein
MARKILNATFGLAGLLGKPFGSGKKKKPEAPAPGPVVMPLADDEAVRRARRRSMSTPRAGRTSTMLTADSDTLGG